MLVLAWVGLASGKVRIPDRDAAILPGLRARHEKDRTSNKNKRKKRENYVKELRDRITYIDIIDQ